jgi:hypothetical protein
MGSDNGWTSGLLVGATILSCADHDLFPRRKLARPAGLLQVAGLDDLQGGALQDHVRHQILGLADVDHILDLGHETQGPALTVADHGDCWASILGSDSALQTPMATRLETRPNGGHEQIPTLRDRGFRSWIGPRFRLGHTRGRRSATVVTGVPLGPIRL